MRFERQIMGFAIASALASCADRAAGGGEKIVARSSVVASVIPPRASGASVLEVSSPGLDRPLRKPEHFRRFIGQRALVSLKIGLGDSEPRRRNFTGSLLGLSDDGATVRLRTDDAKEYDLPLVDLDKAQLKPDFSAIGAKG